MKLYLCRLPHPHGKADFLMIPIGLLYLKAAVDEQQLAEVTVKDFTLYHFTEAEKIFIRDLKNNSPDIIGISAFSRDFELVRQYCALVRTYLPASKIVIGGPISGTSIEKLLEYGDFIISGEGEHALCEFIKTLMSSTPDFSAVPNLIYIQNSHIIKNPVVFIDDVDAIPSICWDNVDLEPYFNAHSFIRFRKEKKYAPLFTSRGCPFECAYCHKLFGKNYRPHSPQRVVNDIKRLYAKGVKEFQIIDDSFNLDKTRVKKIFELLDEEQITDIAFAFPNGVEATQLDEEILRILKDHGAYYMSFAIESASPRVRKHINKRQKLSKVIHALKIASRMRIFCNGFFMVGFPDEYEVEIKQTLKLMLNPYLHSAEVFNVMIYPETPLAEQTGTCIDHSADFDYFSKEINFSEHVSAEHINALRHKAFIRFYADPVRMYRLLRDLRTYENKCIVLIQLIVLFICKMAGRIYGWKDHN